MKSQLKTISLAALTALWLLSGCTVTTRDVSTDEVMHYDEAYDPSDKKKIVDTFVSSLLEKSPVPETAQRPVIVVYGISNRTDEHISTDLISDDIRQALLESGRFRFVNIEQRDNIDKEAGYQYNGPVAPETRIKLARQVGAQYMMTGNLRSIEKTEPRQIRLKKKELKYYSLHLELTNIETGLIEWNKSVEIMREAAKPFIGW